MVVRNRWDFRKYFTLNKAKSQTEEEVRKLVWFIGFAEGDGCWMRSKASKNRMRSMFLLNQKESKVLYKVQELLGFGGVVVCDGGRYHRFRVTKKEEVEKLVALFNGHLVMKKTQERFRLFGEHVEEIVSFGNKPSLEDAWLRGFIDAEGCFSKKSMSLTQKGEQDTIYGLKELFRGGSAWTQTRGKEIYRFRLESKKGYGLLRDYLQKFPLETEKVEDFERWCKVWRGEFVAPKEKKQAGESLPSFEVSEEVKALRTAVSPSVRTNVWDFKEFLDQSPHLQSDKSAEDDLKWFIGFAEAKATWRRDSSFILQQRDPKVLYKVCDLLGFGRVKGPYGGSVGFAYYRYRVRDKSSLMKLGRLFEGNLVLERRKEEFPLLWGSGKSCNNKVSFSDPWLRGFLDGAGTFGVQVSYLKDKEGNRTDVPKQILVRYVVLLGDCDKGMLRDFKSLLKRGSLRRQKRGNKLRVEFSYVPARVKFCPLVDYLSTYPLQSQKKVSFVRWCKVQQRLVDGADHRGDRAQRRLNTLLLELQKEKLL